MLKQLADYAMRVARAMSRDPEAESIANEAALRAYRRYDPEMGVPIERWVAICVRHDVWCMWRRKASRSETTKAEVWWEAVEAPPQEDILERKRVSDEDWQLLYEVHLEKRFMDVVARDRGISVCELRNMLRAAESRFLEAME